MALEIGMIDRYSNLFFRNFLPSPRGGGKVFLLSVAVYLAVFSAYFNCRESRGRGVLCV